MEKDLRQTPTSCDCTHFMKVSTILQSLWQESMPRQYYFHRQDCKIPQRGTESDQVGDIKF